MGNRAVVKPVNSDIGVYLHWNGGLDSVTAFLEYCKLRQFRDFGGKNSDGYGMARFCQVVGNYFGGRLSIGIEHISETEEDAEWLDNGIYVIDGWNIVKRIGGVDGHEGYDLTEFLIDIDNAQPPNDRLGAEFIMADDVDASELRVGDTVFVMRYDDHFQKCKVIGISYDFVGNSVPYIDLCSGGLANPNNRLCGKCRKLSHNMP